MSITHSLAGDAGHQCNVICSQSRCRCRHITHLLCGNMGPYASCKPECIQPICGTHDHNVTTDIHADAGKAMCLCVGGEVKDLQLTASCIQECHLQWHMHMQSVVVFVGS
jgi:hypothetical protein